MSDNNTTDQSLFNMGLVMVQSFHNIINRGGKYFERGDNESCFHTLKSLRIQASHRFPEHIDSLKQMEDEIVNPPLANKIMNNTINLHGDVLDQEEKRRLIYKLSRKKLEEYFEFLLVCMDEKGLLMPSEKDMTSFA